MSWVCLTCHQATSGYPAQPTLNPLYRKGYCAPEDKPDRVFQNYISAGPKDPRMGDELKERGMARADFNAVLLGGEWPRRFNRALRELARSGREFTSEDVTVKVGMSPAHPSAVGSKMNAASKAGLIEWTGAMRQAERPNQHRALLKVWRGQNGVLR